MGGWARRLLLPPVPWLCFRGPTLPSPASCIAHPLQYQEGDEAWKDGPPPGLPQLSVANPAYDYVPPELISLFVTGALAPGGLRLCATRWILPCRASSPAPGGIPPHDTTYPH